MINHYIPIALTLILIEIVVLRVSSHSYFKKYFEFLPAVFWIYFIPMLFSTFHIIPSESPIYQAITRYCLPVSLFLLLIGVDLPAIMKLGSSAIVTMLAGSAGIMIGAPIVLLLFKHWLPENTWMGFGALSGSWIGGSANMIAVKEAAHVSDAVFLPMIAVDIVVAYSWMGILIALAPYQSIFDKWNGSDVKVLQELKARAKVNLGNSTKNVFSIIPVIVAIIATGLAVLSSKLIPETKSFSSSTWVIILISSFALALSVTPLRKLESKGASKIGYWVLYFVLASIGAKADLRYIASAPVLILAGFTWVLFHFAWLLLISRFTKAPLALIATASQANIGGPVSAPIVAAVYDTSLAPVGLLLGIFGNIIGTYLGLICFKLCDAVH